MRQLLADYRKDYMTDQYIQGAFFGALVLCVLMLNFPKDRECEVRVNYGKVVNVSVGHYVD